MSYDRPCEHRILESPDRSATGARGNRDPQGPTHESTKPPIPGAPSPGLPVRGLCAQRRSQPGQRRSQPGPPRLTMALNAPAPPRRAHERALRDEAAPSPSNRRAAPREISQILARLLRPLQALVTTGVRP